MKTKFGLLVVMMFFETNPILRMQTYSIPNVYANGIENSINYYEKFRHLKSLLFSRFKSIFGRIKENRNIHAFKNNIK